MQAVGREAPGDVCDACSSSLAASQFLPILEESRSPSADARALAPFKGNRRSGGSARARELPPPPSHKPRGPGPGSLRGLPHTLPNLSALHPLWGHSNLGERRACPCLLPSRRAPPTPPSPSNRQTLLP